MPYNRGLLKEIQIVQDINGKTYDKLKNNLKELMLCLYGIIDEDEIFHCRKIEEFMKPDIVITYKGIEKYISIKTGRAQVIHQESIKSFILFLRGLGISTKTQKTLLRYLYGDGTLDGSGKERFDYHVIRVLLHKEIKEANEELNGDKKILAKVIERCLFIGNLECAIKIDGVYFGDSRFGFLATINQIEKHIQRKNWDWMENLHIDPLQIRPHARYVGKEIKNPKYRERLDVYWANLEQDLNYISTRYEP